MANDSHQRQGLRQRWRAAPVLALTGARIKQFFREPGAVFWTFGFPLLITVALGVAFRQQGPSRARLAIVGVGPAAAEIAQTLAGDPELSIARLSPATADAQLRTGEVLVVVELEPPRPAGALTPGATSSGASGAAGATDGNSDGRADRPRVVYRYDPSRPDARAARRHVDDVLQRRAGRADVLPTGDQTAVMRGGRYIDWLVPGLLGMQLLSGALWGTAWNVVTARQRKLLKRLAATPMRRADYLLSYQLAGLMFVPLQVIVLFAFARATFGVRVFGSSLSVVGLSLFASWSFAGLGLLCASRAENTETANGLINLVTLPMYVVSGVFFSSARFPELLQPVIRWLPLSAFNEALRHIVNDGASLVSQASQLAVLLIWGAVSFGLALRLFRWT